MNSELKQKIINHIKIEKGLKIKEILSDEKYLNSTHINVILENDVVLSIFLVNENSKYTMYKKCPHVVDTNNNLFILIVVISNNEEILYSKFINYHSINASTKTVLNKENGKPIFLLIKNKVYRYGKNTLEESIRDLEILPKLLEKEIYLRATAKRTEDRIGRVLDVIKDGNSNKSEVRKYVEIMKKYLDSFEEEVLDIIDKKYNYETDEFD